jgi:DNA invertase Pin-like site-specific DNA recombinase
MQLDGDSLRRQYQGAANYIDKGKHTLADLTMKDMGVRAFRGENKHKGALSVFLDAIKENKVPKGSILLVENLDRLSREGIHEAFRLFSDILSAGVKIVTLMPVERVYDKDSLTNIATVLEPLIAFHLAHEESLKKRERLKSHWDERRNQINNKPLSKRRPSWIDWDDEKGFILNKEKAKAIQFIFQRCIDGIGQKQILTEVADKFDPMGTSGAWTGSFVSKVLTDPTTFGQLQLHEFTRDGDRVPTGKPIDNYYPAAIDEGTYQRARLASKRRFNFKTGRQSEFVNLLSGLVFNARDKSVMHIQTSRAYKSKNGKKKETPHTQRRLVSYNSLRKMKGACKKSFLVDHVERYVLTVLQGVKLSDMKPDNKTVEIEKAKAELETVETRLEELAKALTDVSNPLPQIIAAMTELQQRQKQLKEALQENIHTEPVSDLLTQVSNDSIFADDNDKRRKLRGVILQLVERVDLLLWEINPRRVGCLIQVTLKNGGLHTAILTSNNNLPYVTDINIATTKKTPLNKLVKDVEKWRQRFE